MSERTEAALPQPRALLVDDDAALTRGIARTLTRAGFLIEVAYDGAAAARAVAERAFDVVLSDIDLPEMDGLSLLRRVRKIDVDLPVVLITGNPSVETAIEAVERGALRYLRKPVDGAALCAVANEAVALHRVARAKRRALEMAGGFDRLVGEASDLEARFERALSLMRVFYQPIVMATEQRVYGYEGLLRSGEPTLGNPAVLLDAAERLGRLNDLGRGVRARVAERIACTHDETLFFVNLHTRDLLDDDLFSRDSRLAAHANRVVLEITERASMNDVPDAPGRIAALRALGYRIAIDDLGAGYAGLTSFAILEPDVVKLDMSLVRDVHKNPTKRTLVRTMTAMCKDLGMRVVGEGVEVAEERDCLIEARCDLLQGYLYARPADGLPDVRF